MIISYIVHSFLHTEYKPILLKTGAFEVVNAEKDWDSATVLRVELFTLNRRRYNDFILNVWFGLFLRIFY